MQDRTGSLMCNNIESLADQLYNDGVWKTEPLKEWLDIPSAKVHPWHPSLMYKLSFAPDYWDAQSHVTARAMLQYSSVPHQIFPQPTFSSAGAVAAPFHGRDGEDGDQLAVQPLPAALF